MHTYGKDLINGVMTKKEFDTFRKDFNDFKKFITEKLSAKPGDLTPNNDDDGGSHCCGPIEIVPGKT